MRGDPVVRWEGESQGADGWAANDYMKGWVGNRRGSSTGLVPRGGLVWTSSWRGILVSLNPRALGWRAGVCCVACVGQQRWAPVGLSQSARVENS